MDDDHDPPDDPRLVEVIDDLRAAFLTAPDEDVARRHLERLQAVSAGAVPLRRRPLPSVAVVAATGLAVAVLGFGGAAAANDALPDPLQDGVSALAGVVGIDLPHGDDEGEGGRRPTEVPPPVAPVGPLDLLVPQAPIADPGRSEDAPGHGGEIPGREETAPGQTDTAGETNNKPEVPPGQTDDTGNAPDAPPGQDQVTPAPSTGVAPDQPGAGAPGKTK